MTQLPSVARIVHYVSYGTPGGEYPSVCRAAVITDVYDNDNDNVSNVSLCVFNPEGLFFNKNVEYNELGDTGGTWHWPERV